MYQPTKGTLKKKSAKDSFYDVYAIVFFFFLFSL